MKEDHEQQIWREYVADMSCAIARKMICKSSFPFYSDMVKKQHAQKDSRSGKEIVDGLIADRRRKRLRGGQK